jgi:hypothetical protein
MGDTTLNLPATLQKNVQCILSEFMVSVQAAFGDGLYSAVLFGSAAEGALRKTSDVNLLLVLHRYDPTSVDKTRAHLQAAEAAIRLNVMFLCQSELEIAANSFAQKFSDILHRHVILCGTDPFVGMTISRAAQVRRLRQVLLNLLLRLRETYASNEPSGRAVTESLTEAVSVLRTSAALMLELSGRDGGKPKQALINLAEELAPGHYTQTLAALSQMREGGVLTAPQTRDAMLHVMELAAAMQTRANAFNE